MYNEVNVSVVQTARGLVPQGFVAMEFQELLRLRILPACEEACAKYFNPRTSEWFSLKVYNAALRDVLWPADRSRPFFFLFMDKDKRHSLNLHKEPYRLRGTAKPPPVDRRTIKEGEYGWLRLDKCQEPPGAEKCPDTLQCPIEMLFGSVKQHFRKALAKHTETDVELVWKLAQEAFEAYDDQPAIERRFDHALDSIQVWCAEQSDWVEIDGVQYKGTNGNQVHKKLRG